MRVNARVATVLACAAAVLSSLAAAAVPAGAAAPAADCQPYAAHPCLFPYPDNRFTRPDRHSATGVRRGHAGRGDAGQRPRRPHRGRPL